MRELLKGWMSVFIHFGIGFALCILYVFLFEDPAVLPHFALQWKLAESGLLFIRLMPSLLVSAVLIGYAIIFGTSGHNTVPRYSGVLLRYLRDVFIILSFCITAYIVLMEIIAPALLRYRYYSELKTQDYYDFVKEADISLKNNLFEDAYKKSEAALGIWKESEEAAHILDKVRVLVEAQSAARDEDTVHGTGYDNLITENLTPQGALYISRRYMEVFDFYTAHFYAMRAYKLSPENGPYREEALRLAALSWNRIEQGFADLAADIDVRLYQAKKAGYEMMLQENYIKAYYQFLVAQKIIEDVHSSKRDPDIDRFIEITKKKMLEEVFFIEELESLSVFESFKYIHFTVPAFNEVPAAKIAVEGISFISSKGIQEVYGRNCEITQYDNDGGIQFKCRVPFVKFIPIVHRNGQPMLRLQLQAVDKSNEGLVIRPVVLEGSLPAEQLTVKLLPFSYSTLELIIAACEGEKTMTLPQLYTFRKSGALYGFPAQIYHREIVARISDTLLILIISVYMLVIAWGFRTPQHQRFRTRWIFSFPIFFAGIVFFVETVRYCSRLLIALLTDTVYTYSTLLIFIIYIILFIGLSFLFFAQRSDV